MQLVFMNDNSGLRYMFYQPNLNSKKARWLSTFNEFDFEIRYIKGKENRVVGVLGRKV